MQEVRALGTSPVPGDAPAGADVRYEPQFEQLQQEIDKLSVASATGEPIDWAKVNTLCQTILAEKSKNLMVAAYLGAALVQQRGIDGFADSLAVMRGLVDSFWDGLFPPKKRKRGRINAIEWWSARMTDYLKSVDSPDAYDKPFVDDIQENLKALDSALADKLGDDAPLLHDLMEAAGRIPVKEAPAAPDTPAESPESGQGAGSQGASASAAASAANSATADAPAATPAPSAPPAPQDASDAEAVRKAGVQTLGDWADFVFKTDTANPWVYRVRRMQAWMSLRMLPPNDGGTTQIPAPDTAEASSLANMLTAGDFAGALVGAESRVPQYLFWLDLTRISAEALDGLGPSHAAAKRALEAETILFLDRLKGVEKLSFADGTPFADAQTRGWLQGLGMGQGAGGVAAAGDDPVQAAVDEARAHAAKKDMDTATTTLEEALRTSPAGRDRLRLLGGFVEVLTLSGGGAALAPLAGRVVALVEEWHVGHYDPEAAVQALSTCYRAYSLLPAEEGAASARDVLERIGHLSPAAAIELAQ